MREALEDSARRYIGDLWEGRLHGAASPSHESAGLKTRRRSDMSTAFANSKKQVDATK
jgi:hypothetical protein